MITELTQKQIDMMPTYVDKWITIGMDCERIDKVAARAAVNAMYKNVDLKEPKIIQFADGPTHGFNIYKDMGGTNINDFLNGIMFGQHEAQWLSFYDFFRVEVGVQNLEKVIALNEVAKTCGWVYCAREIAIVMDKPLYVKMDDQNRLHCESGPAIEYLDGTKIYGWHGVRVPANWIEDKSSLTAHTALTVENVEQRRAACEILGWNNILKELDAKILDVDEDPMIGTLVEVDIPEIGRERFLKVLCGTGREFAIPVPPDVNTALEANAWTYGMNPADLRDLEVRT